MRIASNVTELETRCRAPICTIELESHSSQATFLGAYLRAQFGNKPITVPHKCASLRASHLYEALYEALCAGSCKL